MLILFTEIIPVYYENQRKRRNGFCGEEMQSSCLTLNLPTTTIVAQPFHVIKWQLKFIPVA